MSGHGARVLQLGDLGGYRCGRWQWLVLQCCGGELLCCGGEQRRSQGPHSGRLCGCALSRVACAAARGEACSLARAPGPPTPAVSPPAQCGAGVARVLCTRKALPVWVWRARGAGHWKPRPGGGRVRDGRRKLGGVVAGGCLSCLPACLPAPRAGQGWGTSIPTPYPTPTHTCADVWSAALLGGGPGPCAAGGSFHHALPQQPPQRTRGARGRAAAGVSGGPACGGRRAAGRAGHARTGDGLRAACGAAGAREEPVCLGQPQLRPRGADAAGGGAPQHPALVQRALPPEPQLPG
jgi:hypothetical protein